MKHIEKSKMIYENIEIPEELNQVIQNTIKEVTEKRQQPSVVSLEEERIKLQEKGKGKKGIRKALRYLVSTAAAMFLTFTIGLNSSESFAMAMESHPVFGALARVLTVRSYHGFDEAKGIQKDIEVPAIETGEMAKAKGGAVEKVNIDIQKIVDSHLVQAEADFEEYKKSFLEGGGSEEELAERTMDLDVSYEVKYQADDKLSLVLYYSEASAFAYEKAYYYNINLNNNEELTLKEVLGEDYIAIANEQILASMEERMAADEDVYYWGILEEEEEGIQGFTTIDENTEFYINEKGNPVITFEEYQVAPGYMGIQEFEIIG